MVILLLTVLCAFTLFVPATLHNNNDLNRSENMEDFRYCIQKSQNPRFRECVGRVALNFLQRFDENENFTLAEDLVSSKDDTVSARSLINLIDTDPVDFRGILENAGAVFSQRSVEWHMDKIYPGLMLKIGPTADVNSVAEFVMDQSERRLNYEEPSAARTLAKQYLLPFLLGLKFNLVALVPLLFAGICLLLKKSLFLAKLAIYVSSFLGIGGGVAGLLSGLGSIGAGFGGFGAGLGGNVGPGGVLGFGIRGPNQQGFDVASTGGQVGYFPGKTPIYNQHFQDNTDELQHHPSPYKRSDRNVISNKPREFPLENPIISGTTDRFYDFENKMKIQEREGKSLRRNGKLGPSAYEEDEVNLEKRIFNQNDQSGWKVVRL